jgi:hypothetical protein
MTYVQLNRWQRGIYRTDGWGIAALAMSSKADMAAPY